jgi:MFS family permease
MQSFAQGWLVTTLTTSALALGLVNFAFSLPSLLLMPFGGVAADRIDRRTILLWTQGVLLVLAAIMGVLVATGHLQLWHIYLIAVPLGIAAAYEMPAHQAFYPQLIEREDLPLAIPLNQASFHGSRVIGPALGSLVVGLWGTAAAFFANSASFLAVILSLLLIRPRPPAPSSSGSTFGMMREGMEYVRERPAILALLGLTGITTLFIFPNLAVLTPYYAQHVLQVGAGGLGMIMSGSGIGAFIGAALLLGVRAEQRVQRMTIACTVIIGTMSLLAWSQSLWLSTAAAMLQSFCMSQALGLSSVIVQEIIPDHLRGRVMGLYSLMFTGLMPFAAVIIPLLVDRIGMRWELQGAGLLYGICALGFMALLRRHYGQTHRTPDREPPVQRRG